MTDKELKHKNMMVDALNPLLMGEAEPLPEADEQLLASFFADCRMSEIPDDGFSDRVMAALPVEEVSLATSPTVEKAPTAILRLERLWTAACVAIGIISLFAFQGWGYLQDCLFNFKMSFMLNGSRILCQTLDALSQSTNLWMMLGGAVVLTMVWGYNEVMDARQ